LVGPRDFRKLLEFTLYFYRYRVEFDDIDHEGRGRVNESDFASICERTGVLYLSADEMRREFAALDHHDPSRGHIQSGYIQFELFCSWAAKQYIRAGKKEGEEARMLERSKQRLHSRSLEHAAAGQTGSTRPRSPMRKLGGGSGNRSGPPGSEAERRSPHHHRDGHGNHSRAWERHKGMEGADTFYNHERSPGQEWAERRHGAAFKRLERKQSTHKQLLIDQH
jgi:hypothetical protein